MTDRILEIEIFGQRYKIRVKGEEDEKYIGHLTSLVDQKMHEVAVKSQSADTTKIAVLAALNIADELFLSQKKMDQLNEAIRRKIPIIGFDSGVPNAPQGSIYATAATNSYAAAGLAAEKMFPAIKDKVMAATNAKPVTIVDFNQDATSMSVTSRGKGFRDKMIQLIMEAGRSADDIKVTGNPAYIAAD
ncbi:MAG: cell division protein ZapA, partial [Candidatus Aminicenantes bacterium]|nr:cell division protein ZapA [Candidatus Aminicenantes bacterium]